MDINFKKILDEGLERYNEGLISMEDEKERELAKLLASKAGVMVVYILEAYHKEVNENNDQVAVFG